MPRMLNIMKINGFRSPNEMTTASAWRTRTLKVSKFAHADGAR
ncbi:hypothetical protein [Sphingomonas cynarae]